MEKAKMNKTIKLAIFTLILVFCASAFGQSLELKKFEFMKGEFRSRGGDKDVLKGAFSKDGKEFSWIEKEPNNDEFGFITYDEATKSYRLKEMVYRRVEPIYYKGTETSEGFHFYELTASDGVLKEDGEQVLIRRLEPDFFNIEHFRSYVDNIGQKQWIPSEYYSKNLSVEQLDRQIRKGIGELDFLVGKFTEDGGKGQFNGRISDDGKELILTFTSPEKQSDVRITYDFHWDEFYFNGTEKLKGGSKSKIKRAGRIGVLRSGEIDEERYIDFNARINGNMTRITFNSSAKNKVSIESMTYSEEPSKEIIFYSRAK